MYVNPKSMSSKATCENIRPVQFSNESSSSCCLSLRPWLLFWASLRLAVMVVWIAYLVKATYAMFDVYLNILPSIYISEAANNMTFGVVAIVFQLMELTMSVLFIVAGIKKNAKLYLVYYRYCILSLSIYVIVVILCFTLSYEEGRYFGGVYLTYHIHDLPVIYQDGLGFGIVAFLNIGLEILFIYLVKKLENKSSQAEDNVACERV